MTASAYVGLLQQVLDKGYGTSLGIYVPATLQYRSGCSVSSMAVTKKGGRAHVTVTAVVALGFACRARNLSKALTPGSLTVSFGQVQAHDTTLANVSMPSVFSVGLAEGDTPPEETLPENIQFLFFGGLSFGWALCLLGCLGVYRIYTQPPKVGTEQPVSGDEDEMSLALGHTRASLCDTPDLAPGATKHGGGGRVSVTVGPTASASEGQTCYMPQVNPQTGEAEPAPGSTTPGVFPTAPRVLSRDFV